MTTELSALDWGFQSEAEAFVAALRAQGIPFAVTSTRRTSAEQVAYYAQGRAALLAVNSLRAKAGLPPIAAPENTYKITNCDGIKTQSMHQRGLALDVVPAVGGVPKWPRPDDPRWQAIAAVGEALGLEWGGRWTSFPDFPHWQKKGA